MMTNKTEDEIKVIVANNLDNLKWLYPICETILNQLPLSERKRHMHMVAISEGFTNAYQHGNQKKPEAEIKLTFYISENSLKILIEDDGILPIKESVNQIAGPVDQESVSGRGLLLMREIVDEAYYRYDSRGNNVLTLISKFEHSNKRVHSCQGE